MAHKLSSACAEMIASYHFSPQGRPQPLHGLKLVIKEEVLASLERPGGSHEDVGRKKTSITGLTWLARTRYMEMQTSAGSLKAIIDVPMQAQSSNKMVMGFWKTPTCQWDGQHTSMVPLGNVVFIDLQPYKNLMTC